MVATKCETTLILAMRYPTGLPSAIRLAALQSSFTSIFEPEYSVNEDGRFVVFKLVHERVGKIADIFRATLTCTASPLTRTHAGMIHTTNVQISHRSSRSDFKQ